MAQKRPHPHRTKRGFSLILSLGVMAMLLLLCFGAASLLAIQLGVARSSVSKAKAGLNALASARVALGTLQAYAGPDRRISASAGIFDANPATPEKSEGVESPHFVGVWKGGALTANYAKGHDDAFVGWLVSGVTSGDGPTPRRVDYAKKVRLDATNAAALFNPPANQPAAPAGMDDLDRAAVYAEPETIPGVSGSIAWWISDENQKAALNLRVPKDGTTTPLQNAQNSPRFGLKLTGDGDFEKFPEDLPFLKAIGTRASLAFDSAGGTGPGWMSDTRNYFHHVTPYSESLLTDVVNGGLKYDLSLMLAMDKLPDGYFGDTGFVGLEAVNPASSANPYTKAKAGWITPDINPQLSPMFSASTSCEVNRLEWTCWGDVWNYARLYKHPAFDMSSGMLITGSTEACGNGGKHANGVLDPNANVTDWQNLSPWREPVITQAQFLLGYRVKETAPGSNKYNLFVVLRPYVQLWNPYNVPLRLNGAGALNTLQFDVGGFPGGIEVTTTDSTAGSKTYQASWQYFFGTGYYFFAPYINFADTASSGITMAPGEVRVFSPAANPGGNDFRVRLEPGIRPKWGFEARAGNPSAMAPFDGTMTIRFTPGYGNQNWSQGRTDGFYVKINRGRLPNGVNDYGQSECRGWFSGGNSTTPGGYIMSIDPAPVTSTIAQLQPPPSDPDYARYCSLITFRLRSETMADGKSPGFSFGDSLRMIKVPRGLNPDYRKNPDVLLPAYEVVQSKITSDEDIKPGNPLMESDGNRGYAFTGYNSEYGVTALVREHLPLAPLGNLGDLGFARLGGGVAHARRQVANPGCVMRTATNVTLNGYSTVESAFANSFSHPMVPRISVAAPGALPMFPNETFFDFSWIMNSALWDAYCMTGLTARDSRIPEFNPSGTTKTLDDVAEDFFAKGKPLSDPRMLLRDYGVGAAALKNAVVDAGGRPTPDGYTKSAAAIAVDGGFNINSTSVRAWRSLLAGLNGVKVPGIPAATSGNSTPTMSVVPIPVKPGENAVLNSSVQSATTLADINSGAYSKAFNAQRALAGRKLSDARLTVLAQKIVEQVKKRGPFLSMGEFMNRRLEDGDLGDRGALQDAIDASGINDFAKASPALQVGATDIGNLVPAVPNPKAPVGGIGRGLPGYITQSDIVRPVSSHITPRGDTFTIRARGTSDDGATALVELTVRRTVAYLDAADAPYVIPDNRSDDFKTVNKVFGRRFAIIGAPRLIDETN